MEQNPQLEPVLVCPNCKKEIRLTESLAAPLVEATRRQYEQRLADKDSEIARRETEIRKQEKAVDDARKAVDNKITGGIRKEREKVAGRANGDCLLGAAFASTITREGA
jgi:hypothetical protein